ncbi:MAG: flavodoxin family protein [Desulfococcaceae bacterium]
MAEILVAYDSKTGRTRKMAELIAEGVRQAGAGAETKSIEEIKGPDDLKGFDGYIFGCPTYFRDMTEEMKKFLFVAKAAGLKGKVGGAFGSYTHLGDAAKLIHETMQYVFEMDMADMGSFNVKERIIDDGRAADPCGAFGKGIADRVK